MSAHTKALAIALCTLIATSVAAQGTPRSTSRVENVVVLGQNSRLREFYQRRTSHGAGTFLTQDDIRKLNPQFTSDVFKRVPGASIRSARFGNAIRLRGCRPKVWMDGIPMRDIEL